MFSLSRDSSPVHRDYFREAIDAYDAEHQPRSPFNFGSIEWDEFLARRELYRGEMLDIEPEPDDLVTSEAA